MSEAAINITPEQAPVENSQGEENSTPTEGNLENPEQSPEEQVQDAINSGASEKEVKNLIKKLKLKVNGKTIEKEIDLNDENALIRELQMAEAGRGAMQRASELEKRFGAEIKRLQENPWEVLEELGFNPLELSEKKLKEYVQEMEKSPEIKAQEQMQKELEKFRKEAEEAKKREHELKYEMIKKQEAAKLENEITSALSEHKALPKNPKVVSKILDALDWADDKGYKDVSVKDVLPIVEEELKREIAQFMEELPEEMFEAYVGKKNLDRFRKAKVEAATKAPTKPKIEQSVKPLEPKKDKQKGSWRDYMRELESTYGQKDIEW